MKATSIFGGVQLFNIIIAIVRFKFIAILLGPAGMGIAGLLTSSVNLISGVTNFGLGTSAVKDVATANGTDNTLKISKTIIVLRRLVWLTGMLGTIFTLIFSRWLSQITFGNHNYTWAFIFLSVTLLLMQLSKGQLVILQGLRKIQHLAKANLLGSFVGLLLTIPLYYVIGVKGIVPAMIIAAFITLFFSWYYARKVQVKALNVSWNRTIFEGKKMLYLGLMISLSSLISLAAAYGVKIFISHTRGLGQVGLFNAGFDIVNGYVGIILTAMAADYFPRLASVAHDNLVAKKTINQQAEIAVLLLSPLIIIIIVFIHWIVILLYSSKFSEIDVMIQWASVGLIFQASSWVVAYALLAKGAGKLYFINEVVGITYLTIFNILGYYFMGLAGLGISFLVGYFIFLIQILMVTKVKYGFSFDMAFIRIFFIQLALAVCALMIVKFMPKFYGPFMGSILIIISLLYSYKELNKRLNLSELIKNIRK